MTMLELAKRHRDADMLIAQTYGEEINGQFKGCSVGCFAHDLGLSNDDHAGVAAAFKIPEWAVCLQDTMFEGLALSKNHKDWHVDFSAACDGVNDWQKALHAVHVAILTVSLRGAGGCADAVQAVIDLHKANETNSNAWSAAKSAARSAARSAAWSAERSAAWSAAWSAARSAAGSAESAAWSAAWSAESAAWSAESAAYLEIRDLILTSMKAN